MELETLFTEIEENLEASRKVFIKTHLDDDEDDFRSLKESKNILKSLSEIALSALSVLKEYPSLESIFDKEFGSFKGIFSRDNILQTCLSENYLIPDAQEFPLPEDHVVESEMLNNYVLSFKDWLDKVKSSHTESQKKILENFTLELNFSQIECHCQKCTADFRAKLRETIYLSQVKVIDDASLEIENLLLESQITSISDYISKLRKKIDRAIGQARYKLKRGSLNKLESDVKSHFKRLLGPRS